MSPSKYTTTNNPSATTISILRQTNRCGSCQSNCTSESKYTWHRWNQRLRNCGSTYTSTFQSNISRSKRINGWHLLRLKKGLLENRLKRHWPTIIPTNKEMKSITSGTPSISVLKMIRKKKPRLQGVILTLMWGIRLQICSTKRVAHIFVYFLPGAAAPMESTASITTEFPPSILANSSTSPKTFSAEPGSAHTAMTWKASALSPNKPELSTSAITSYLLTKMASRKCTKSYWGISPYGATSKISTFYRTKATRLSNISTDVWPNTLNKPWPIKP